MGTSRKAAGTPRQVSDLVDFWVIKIKKSLWSFVHVVRRDHVNRAEHERFVYSIVKLTRLNYETWLTDLYGKFTKVCGPFCS